MAYKSEVDCLNEILLWVKNIANEIGAGGSGVEIVAFNTSTVLPANTTTLINYTQNVKVKRILCEGNGDGRFHIYLGGVKKAILRNSASNPQVWIDLGAFDTTSVKIDVENLETVNQLDFSVSLFGIQG